jgi:hypothetical protein
MGAGVDKIVWATVRDLLLDGDALGREIAGWLQQETSDAADAQLQKRATDRLKDLHRQRERLIDALQSGALDLGDFRPRKDHLEERILAVEHELAEARSRQSRRELAVRHAESAPAIAARLRERLRDPDFKLKRAILSLVVEKVVVLHHRLEIHLALPVSGSFDLMLDRGATLSRFQTLGVRLTATCGKRGDFAWTRLPREPSTVARSRGEPPRALWLSCRSKTGGLELAREHTMWEPCTSTSLRIPARSPWTTPRRTAPWNVVWIGSFASADHSQRDRLT